MPNSTCKETKDMKLVKDNDVGARTYILIFFSLCLVYSLLFVYPSRAAEEVALDRVRRGSQKVGEESPFTLPTE